MVIMKVKQQYTKHVWHILNTETLAFVIYIPYTVNTYYIDISECTLVAIQC